MTRIEESVAKMEELISNIKIKAIEQAEKVEADGKVQIEAIADKTISTIENSINKLEDMAAQLADENEVTDFLNRLEGKCKDVAEFTINKIEEVKPAVKEVIEDAHINFEETISNLSEKLRKKEEQETEVKQEENSVYEETKKLKTDVEEPVEITIPEEVKTEVENKPVEYINPIENSPIEEIKEPVEIKPIVETPIKKESSYDEDIKKILENENVRNILKFIIETKEKATEIYNKPETQELIKKAKYKTVDLAEKGLDLLKVVLDRVDEKTNEDDK